MSWQDRMRRAASVALALLSAGGAAALAGGHAGLVDMRREAMKDMAAAAKTINSMFEGRVAYDRQTFSDAAQTIRAHGGAALVAAFPADSLGPPSAAKPGIATDPDEFAALAGKLQDYAAALSAKADEHLTPAMRMGADVGGGSLLGRRAHEDLQSTPAEHVFHMMMQNCTSCHARYRERLQP